jgi:MFS transporter, ACS family, pantothenate transporter
VAAVIGGKARLPTVEEMRAEYKQRIQDKGFGRSFHSLKGQDDVYVGELLAWINGDIVAAGEPPIPGYSDTWRDAKVEQIARMKAFLGDASQQKAQPVLLEACG